MKSILLPNELHTRLKQHCQEQNKIMSHEVWSILSSYLATVAPTQPQPTDEKKGPTQEE